tara:strand:+ start:1583 stop:1777 length:195 start_codon:yes stop_codon:yes gene_type:complete
MELLLVLTTMLFFDTNSNFFEKANEQHIEGYKWEYIGKSVPSGSPALTIQPDNGNDFILYRLER